MKAVKCWTHIQIPDTEEEIQIQLRRTQSSKPGVSVRVATSSIDQSNMNELTTACNDCGLETMSAATDALRGLVAKYPRILETYVEKYVDKEELQYWLNQKLKGDPDKEVPRWQVNINASQRLTVSVKDYTQEGSIRWELARYVSELVGTDAVVLYLTDVSQNALRKFCPVARKPLSRCFDIEDPQSLAAFVAKRKKPRRLTMSEALQRFPDGFRAEADGDEGGYPENSEYLLCLPIINPIGETVGVIELHRGSELGAFTATEEAIANSYLVWGGIAFYYADMNITLNKQKKLNDFLLDVVRSIFQDMVSMDSVIKKVMKFAQKLVDADRASLFLVDSKTRELYARIFDLDLEASGRRNEEDDNSSGVVKEIRFALGTGIAGQVASTGKPLKVPDAYDDPRFNSAVDKLTGYRTKSILCMPIFIRSTVIGVVQMVNKKLGEFNHDDEASFETFAVYCGLALHHAKLYDKIRRSEQKSKVAVEILSYHNTCSDSEFEDFRQDGIPENIVGIDDFYFAPSTVENTRKVHYAAYMFVDLFGLQRFDLDSLYRFCLTVKKNYRRVPYHNWSHGWTVANAMYCLLKTSDVFKPMEKLALFIGSLCHDLDHRGKNNKFLADTASPLASIYTTSTMEHHHFNQTITILQQDGHNIFSQLNPDEYKQVLSSIKHCILATDLALFFPYKSRLQELIRKDAYSWENADHRLLTQAIAMTGADLCASAKPWEVQKETVRVIFEEFYDQGDYEKSMGRRPIPMMDRDQMDQQPECQVGFLNGICVPCYDILNKLIPETAPLLDGCQRNLARWQALADSQKQLKQNRSE